MGTVFITRQGTSLLDGLRHPEAPLGTPFSVSPILPRSKRCPNAEGKAGAVGLVEPTVPRQLQTSVRLSRMDAVAAPR